MSDTTTVTAYLQAIEDKLRSHFGGDIRQVGAWQPRDADGYADTEILTPALLIYVPGLATQSETYKPHAVGWVASINVLCVLSRDTDNIQTKLLELGAAVGGMVSTHDAAPMRPPKVGQRWGLSDAVDAPDRASLSIRPTDLSIPGLAAVNVEWSQTIYLPETLPEAP